MPEWLKKLFEKLDHPQKVLHISYQTLESELVGLRQDLAQAIATETQLEKRLSDSKNTPEQTARLETE